MQAQVIKGYYSMDEPALINASQTGDLEAFNQLVLTYQTQAYNLALRFLNDEEAAADATQISFINAYQNIKSFRGGSFRAWLCALSPTIAMMNYVARNANRPNLWTATIP